jgi:hypothetical protein
LIYPGPAFAQILAQHGPAIFLLNLRNALLLALLFLLLFGPGEEVSGQGDASATPGAPPGPSSQHDPS